MGWDTNVIIIGEGIKSRDISLKIANEIFNKDSKYHGKESFYIANSGSDYLMYYSYERTRRMPYRLLQDISKIHKNISFTILGSMLEYVGGPAGIIRIKNGKIIDSYGIYFSNGEENRYDILQSPIKNKEIIFQWFKTNGLESELRNNFLNDFPLGWCDEDFSHKEIPIDESQFHIENEQKINWIKQATFSLSFSFTEYSKIPLEQMEINEKSFISFIEYNKTVKSIDREIIDILNGEILRCGLLYLFGITFGELSSNNTILKKRYKTILDIENDLKKYRKEIVKWGEESLTNKTIIRECIGLSVKYLFEMMNSDKELLTNKKLS
ncbi:hypothetical protein [Aureivirga marina]|uniref:hypothetical protein n=1 Tax=Aureivirga marina TaxID=1182451 RepID=UPI0018CAC222|nr:hypothetical protein [Aureivirga marina]